MHANGEVRGLSVTSTSSSQAAVIHKLSWWALPTLPCWSVMYVYVYTHVYIYMCVNVYIYKCSSAYVCVYVYIHI